MNEKKKSIRRPWHLPIFIFLSFRFAIQYYSIVSFPSPLFYCDWFYWIETFSFDEKKKIIKEKFGNGYSKQLENFVNFMVAFSDCMIEFDAIVSKKFETKIQRQNTSCAVEKRNIRTMEIRLINLGLINYMKCHQYVSFRANWEFCLYVYMAFIFEKKKSQKTFIDFVIWI